MKQKILILLFTVFLSFASDIIKTNNTISAINIDYQNKKNRTNEYTTIEAALDSIDAIFKGLNCKSLLYGPKFIYDKGKDYSNHDNIKSFEDNGCTEEQLMKEISRFEFNPLEKYSKLDSLPDNHTVTLIYLFEKILRTTLFPDEVIQNILKLKRICSSNYRYLYEIS